jgi:hypothetical protein
MKPAIERIELCAEELERLLERAWEYLTESMALGYHLKTGHTLSVQNRPTGLA